ncbi:MAG TPA: hypothetical protein VK517_02130 [Cyclobacteriaceae bacterium]|nr:hypothetical protein [Cyclobacteriaceae bacterium]
MKRFILKNVVFLGILFMTALPPTLLYINRDVYEDFGYHKNYSWKYNFQGLGDIATKKLLQSPLPYNSFIFGSSRSAYLYACYLNKKIKNACFFHYASWFENIGGIYAKLKLLDSLNYKIDNAVIYLDTDGVTFKDDGRISATEHYLLTNQSPANYYFTHYKMFFSSFTMDKLKILLGMRVSGLVFPNWESDLRTNDPRHICSERILNGYGNTEMDQAYRGKIDSLKRTGILFERSGFNQPRREKKQISVNEENILLKIRELFKKHGTNYYIVITPLYDQMQFDSSDMQILRTIFGNRIYDFSGVNEITNNEYNYFDGIHFRPCISKQMIDSILGHPYAEGRAFLVPAQSSVLKTVGLKH